MERPRIKHGETGASFIERQEKYIEYLEGKLLIDDWNKTKYNAISREDRMSLIQECVGILNILNYHEEVEKTKIASTVKGINERRREKELAKANGSKG